MLYLEVRLLDDWNRDAWLTLYTPDARCIVATTDLPEGDPASDIVFIDDDYRRSQGRVVRLQSLQLAGSTPGPEPAGSFPT